MDITVIIFLVVSFGSLIGAFVLEGGHFVALFIGTAAIMVFGGTIGAVGLSFPMDELKRIPKVIGIIFKYRGENYEGIVSQVYKLALEARQDGLLALEKYTSDKEITERVLKKGLGLVVDGIEAEHIKRTLETDVESVNARHEGAIALFEAAGGYAPTMGIIGTVMGLVHVLGNLDDPSTLGPKIAVAFIATLYGVASANLLWLPIASRLKIINEKESIKNEMIVEGITSLQEGKNPKLMLEDMCSFLRVEERDKIFATLNLR